MKLRFWPHMKKYPPHSVEAGTFIACYLGVEYVQNSISYDDFSRFLSVPYTEALKSVRTALGLSQKTFAEQMGIVPNYYYKIEDGNRRPSRKVYRKICVALEAIGL